MSSIEELESVVEEIKKRNQRVEIDKLWETSWTRKSVIVVLTYAIVVIFLYIVHVSTPFINAIVPVIGFILSTLTVSFFKKMWINKFYR